MPLDGGGFDIVAMARRPDELTGLVTAVDGIPPAFRRDGGALCRVLPGGRPGRARARSRLAPAGASAPTSWAGRGVELGKASTRRGW